MKKIYLLLFCLAYGVGAVKAQAPGGSITAITVKYMNGGSWIKGSITEPGRVGLIEVLSFNMDESRAVDPKGRPAGEVKTSWATFTKPMDMASPLLKQALHTSPVKVGNDKVEVSFWGKKSNNSATESILYTVTLSGVICTSVNDVVTPASNNNPMECYQQVSFFFREAQWTWTDGSITFKKEYPMPGPY